MSNIKLNRYFYVVEITTLSNDTMKFSYTLFKLEQNSIKLLDFNKIDNLEELPKKLNKSTPIILNICGKGIINKRVDNQSDSLLYSNKNNFYNIEISGYDTHFISIIKKDFLDRIFKQFSSQNIFVIDINFGPFITASINQITDNLSELFLANYILHFKDNLLFDFKENYENIRQDLYIQDEKIASDNIIAYAALTNYLYPNDNVTKNIPSLTHSTDEFRYKKLLEIIGKTSVFVIFFVLLLNIFVSNKLHKKQLALKSRLSKIENLYDSINFLKNALSLKEEIIRKNVVNTKEYFSYYQNELLKIIPDEITIKTFEFNPRLSKNDDTFHFENKLIKINGNSNNAQVLYDWIKKINENKWVNYVKIKNLVQSKANTIIFEIIISIE